MASLTTDKYGYRRLLFVGTDQKRKTIHLGYIPKRTASEIKRHVEAIVVATRAGMSIDAETASWLGKIGDDVHQKLVAVGLAGGRLRSSSVTLADYWDEFVAGKGSTVKPRSVSAMNQVRDRAGEFFGPARRLVDVSAGDAERFADWLRGKYAQATAARTLKRMKQLYVRAVKDGVIPLNPFDGIRPGSMANPGRLRYVTVDEVARVIDAAPDAEWRAVIALARFAGLRIPSELTGLTWGDVNWSDKRIVLHSPKLEHSASSGVRVVPILPELLPHLDALSHAAPTGKSAVCPNLAHGRSGNLRTQMRRIIERAGLVPWERTFQNLRASFTIDLHNRFPAHVAHAWAGHTERVALGHYLGVQDEHFDRATRTDAPTDARRSGQARTARDIGPSEARKKTGKADKHEEYESTPVAPA